MPPSCLICEQSADSVTRLCENCNAFIRQSRQQQLKPGCQSPQRCLRCAVDLDSGLSDGALHCAQCIKQPPRFHCCVTATSYNPITGKLINQLKHHSKLSATLPIAANMVEAIQSHYAHSADTIDLVIPVPLHIDRLRQRGFNQANEIAKPICKALGLKLAFNLCERRFDNPPQQQAGLAARHKNLRGAFIVNADVKGKYIAIVDDVVTTGATANAVTKSLLDAGAARCDIWCFSRTPRKQ
ncbi:MAG TPA: hypothetical protein DCE61_07405 [Cellvibrionales bacterium]|nr:hypothetical protein [Cellvibrionales bacterium]